MRRSRLIAKEMLEIHNTYFEVSYYIGNQKNPTASVLPNRIHIRYPADLNEADQKQIRLNLLNWAEMTIQAAPHKFIKTDRHYESNQTIKTLIKDYILQINSSETLTQKSTAQLKKNIIQIDLRKDMPEFLAQEHIKFLIPRIIAQDYKDFINTKVKRINAESFQVKVGNVSFRDKNTSWGTCTNRGNIILSVKLVLAPENVLDYICVHELSHIVHQDHSVHFWNLVKKVMPDYLDKENWLKKNGASLVF